MNAGRNASPPGPLSFREGESTKPLSSGPPSLKERGPGGEALR